MRLLCTTIHTYYQGNVLESYAYVLLDSYVPVRCCPTCGMVLYRGKDKSLRDIYAEFHQSLDEHEALFPGEKINLEIFEQAYAGNSFYTLPNNSDVIYDNMQQSWVKKSESPGAGCNPSYDTPEKYHGLPKNFPTFQGNIENISVEDKIFLDLLWDTLDALLAFEISSPQPSLSLQFLQKIQEQRQHKQSARVLNSLNPGVTVRPVTETVSVKNTGSIKVGSQRVRDVSPVYAQNLAAQKADESFLDTVERNAQETAALQQEIELRNINGGFLTLLENLEEDVKEKIEEKTLWPRQQKQKKS